MTKYVLIALLLNACTNSSKPTNDFGHNTRDLDSDLGAKDVNTYDLKSTDIVQDTFIDTSQDLVSHAAPSFELFSIPSFPKELLQPIDTNFIQRKDVESLDRIFLRMAKNEFKPISVVVRAKDKVELKISTSSFKNQNGDTIPSTEIDTRVLMSWYQSGDGKHTTRKVPGGPYLTPKFLLHDPTLLKVDLENQKNFLSISSGGKTKYLDVSDPESIFPLDSELRDSKEFTTLELAKEKHAQLWITVHVPKNLRSGSYQGVYTIEDIEKGYRKEIPFEIEVLPLDLVNLADIEFESAIYYRGKLFDGIIDNHKKVLSTEWKNEAQYEADMRNLLDHGVLNPTVYQKFSPNNAADVQSIEDVIAVRKRAGMKSGKFLSLGAYIGKGSTQSELRGISERVNQLRERVEVHGYSAYFYGFDEAKGERLRSQKPAWEAVQQAGGKMFVAGDPGTFDEMGNRLNMLVTGHRFVPPGEAKSEIQKGHEHNAKVLKYGDPFAGMTGPKRFRANYGYRVECHGYDGLMPYVYQHGIGYSWNDFDPSPRDTSYEKLKNFRDMSLTYPTTDGVIDTIEWEAYREAIDDIRYIKTLMRNQPDKVSWFTNRFCDDSKVFSPVGIRKEVVNKLLDPSAQDQPVDVEAFGDGKIREELNIMKGALECYGNAHQTFHIPNTGWKGFGVGHISLGNSGAYKKSIVNGLKDAGCLEPHISFESSKSSYPFLLYLCDSGKKFAVFGRLMTTTPSDNTVFANACNSNAASIGERNFASVGAL